MQVPILESWPKPVCAFLTNTKLEHVQYSNSNLAMHVSLLFCADNAMGSPVPQEIRVAPPAYQTEDLFFSLDLSCLVGGEHDQPEDKSALNQIKAIEGYAGDWPDQTLQQMTTLDHSQLQALKVVVF